MNVTKLPQRRDTPGQFRTVQDLLSHRRPSYTEEDLTMALSEQMLRSPETVALPSTAQSFWEAHSGTGNHEASAGRATASNAVARAVLDAEALTAEEVAQVLGKNSSTVRHYKSARKLYSYSRRGHRQFFPRWQFTSQGTAIPFLAEVLAVMGEDIHPQTVSGFFLAPQADLMMDGQPQSPKRWLESGGAADIVVANARELGASL
ncbi:hypothetical protein [Arthrobacter sp. H5]|uniref:hypothetical protein n=1 Tax=Arthrobacter sp. H5 TaxID=1267973 RepID=UPI0004B29ED1|nr:hypothetical protein [Arthrobacter sp. H5]